MFDVILRADQAILNGIQDLLRCEFLDVFLAFVTKLGNAGFIWILLGLILCCFQKWRRTGVILLCSVAAAFLIGEVAIKPMVGRLRPFMDNAAVQLLIDPPRGFSFPSGHSMSSFAAATALFLCGNRRVSWLWYLGAVLIALSRLYLYVHYPSDVLTGAVLGCLTAWAVYAIFKRFWSRGNVKIFKEL